MKSKNILIALGVGALAYLLLKKKTPAGQYPVTPVRNQQIPPRGSFAFQQWLNTMLDTYGRAAWMFEPGGPFYNSKIFNEKELNKVLKEPIYDLPTTPTTPNSPYPGQDDYGDYG